MLRKFAFALALALVTTSGAMAAAGTYGAAPSQNIYSPRGAYVGTTRNVGADPDPGIRFELNRDWSHGRY
jgi:hypothetical protein